LLSVCAGVMVLLPMATVAALPPHIDSEVLVTFKSTASAATLTAKQPGIATLQRVSSRLFRTRLQPDETVETMMAQLQANPLVEHVQPNYIKTLQTNDPYFDQQWGLKNTGQNSGLQGADIDIESALGVTRGDKSIIVAVLDTGIAGGDSATHPDLVNQLWHNPKETADGVDNDGNGIIDDLIGCDVSQSSGSTVIKTGNPIDLDGHGTEVAGVIGAEAGNNIGISGVAPGVSLMIVKAFDGTTSTTANIVAAIEYAVDNGAKIINASYGTPGTPNNNPGFDQAEYDAIKNAMVRGVIFVAPSGNGALTQSGANQGYSNDGSGALSPYVPASYDLSNIVAVAASDDLDELAVFSNYGSSSVDLAAPGQGIVSTGLANKYTISSGTSLAAPFVSGTLALMLSIPGDHSINGLKDRLLLSVDAVPALNGKVASGGRLNAASALSAEPVSRSLGSGGGWLGLLTLCALGGAALLRNR